MNTAVVVPLKRFDRAKSRLRVNSDIDVSAVVEQLARGVVIASRPRPVVIVSEDQELAPFATSLGAELLLSSSTSLNEAVQAAYESLVGRFDQVVIAHGDLCFPERLGDFVCPPGISLYADHLGRGTNVMVVPVGLNFRFAYGPDSLHRHVEEARRLGIACHVDLASSWRFDVDEPDDLENWRRSDASASAVEAHER